jgi:hypothetical protein
VVDAPTLIRVASVQRKARPLYPRRAGLNRSLIVIPTITEVQRWTRKRRIKLNKTKSVHIDFINQRVEHKPIYINHHAVPYENTAKYLGITLDTKLRWKPLVKKKKKKEKLNLKYRKMYWLMGR